MKNLAVSLLVLVASAALLMAGCGQAAPSPAPTTAPAVPTKAAAPAAPTAAPAAPTAAPAAPTQAAAPAKKVEWPSAGKTVTIIVPYAAGGGTDVAARMMASLLEKELKIPVQVVNKTGGGVQAGITELAGAKPDGYTVGYTGNPSVITTYLDPERKANYNRKSLQPIELHFLATSMVVVAADSPYKTLKDLIDAAKAAPEKLTSGTTGLMGTSHLGGLLLEKAAGAKFAFVHFTGDGPSMTALLGGNLDFTTNSTAATLSHIKSGAVRGLAILDSEPDIRLPEVKTAVAQGYDAQMGTTMGISAPAGTPPEIVAILAEAIKKAQGDEGHKSKMTELGYTLRSVGPEGYAKLWADIEARTVPLMEQLRQK